MTANYMSQENKKNVEKIEKELRSDSDKIGPRYIITI